MKIVTAAEMREIDRATSDRYGIPSAQLMENAGTAVANFALAVYPRASQIGIICGKGNNGGDGFVVARKLHEAGKSVPVLLLCDPAELRGDALEMFKKLAAAPVSARTVEELRSPEVQAVFKADLLIDAVLGTGFRPPVSGLYAEAIAAINRGGCPVIAVDIPSGMDADSVNEQPGEAVKSDAVVTFTAPHLAHVFRQIGSGPVVCAPIGSPPEAIVSALNLNVITAQDLAHLLGPRVADANKGSFGHVLIVGGSVGKGGAAAMAGFSALRAGAGLATIATARSVVSAVASFHPETMTEPLEDTSAGTIAISNLKTDRFDEVAKGKNVIALGPGISRHPETADFVRRVVGKFAVPMVVDADGLNAFEGKAQMLTGSDHAVVITPHPGEMARLLGKSIPEVQKDRVNVARNFAREHNLIVVLKGHRTVIAAPDGTAWINTTGNPGMATGGTGDILTGITAGLMAQHPDRVFEAVLLAVFLHGLAGDIACQELGEESLVATDVVRFLPNAFKAARGMLKDPVTRVAGFLPKLGKGKDR